MQHCRRQNTEPGSALKNGDGYVEIVMDAEYSAAAIHQPDGTGRKVPAITQVFVSHVMLYTEGKWWRISNDYLSERFIGGKGLFWLRRIQLLPVRVVLRPRVAAPLG